MKRRVFMSLMGAALAGTSFRIEPAPVPKLAAGPGWTTAPRLPDPEEEVQSTGYARFAEEASLVMWGEVDHCGVGRFPLLLGPMYRVVAAQAYAEGGEPPFIDSINCTGGYLRVSRPGAAWAVVVRAED